MENHGSDRDQTASTIRRELIGVLSEDGKSFPAISAMIAEQTLWIATTERGLLSMVIP
ncbi:MAG: hypothetical protein MZV63_30830 [Marinilabiliales bacterium]|nr:hypothetical protein [Marinilabiliales bacterium]